MSKLITSQYEYALYDDTQGNLAPTQGIPPTYPPALENYRSGSVATAGFGYGAQTVVSTSGNGQQIFTQPGATITFIADVGNTTLVSVQQGIRALVPGGPATNQLYWYVGPGQTVTLPGALNGGQLYLQPTTSAYVATTAPFIINYTWSV